MKSHLWIALRLTFAMVLLTMVAYPLFIRAVAFFIAPGRGNGQEVRAHGRLVGFRQVGQSFTLDRYFQDRPSAVGYNAAGSGASNLGPSNPDLLKGVLQRADTIEAHNPGLTRAGIPADLLTASGSGLDPDITPEAALVQVTRIARIRNLPQDSLVALVHRCTTPPLAGCLGPATVNVLELNLKLDQLK